MRSFISKDKRSTSLSSFACSLPSLTSPLQLYKLQRYEEAAEIYQQLIDSQPAAEIDTELYTNFYSTSVSAGSGTATLSEHHLNDSDIGNSFDLMFNIACAQISSGDLHAAKASLLAASNICHEVLSSEGMSEEEIATESTAIRLQTAFVDILTGRETSSSLEQCKNILRTLKRDNELLAVAANNLAVLRGATDLPDSLRRLRNTISSASEEKLTRSQLMEIRYNRCILLLHLKKIDESLRTLDELDKM
jgi:signal recognition particle subunit SRP72